MAEPATRETVDRYREILEDVRDSLGNESGPRLMEEIALARARAEKAESRDVAALTSEQVTALGEPLDPGRIRTRQGRGGGSFSYLAGHDVKRTANEIFGFGRWGADLVELREIAGIEVKNGSGKSGWHVAYSAIVRVSVDGCVPVSDVGYGDGVEYGPAALATARELAMKEASTDAMKRALTQYGDQFGLILYAKEDEARRISSDRDAASATAAAPPTAAGIDPRSWKEIADAAAAYGPEIGWGEWVKDAAEATFGSGNRDLKALSPDQRKDLSRKAAGAIRALYAAHDPGLFPPPTREEVAAAWTTVLDGIVLPGPMWQMSPEEATLGVPTYAEAVGGSPTPETAGATETPTGDAGSREQPGDAAGDGLSEEEQADADAIPFGD